MDLMELKKQAGQEQIDRFMFLLHGYFVSLFQVYGYFEHWARKNTTNINKFKILHGIHYMGCTRQRDFIKKYKMPRTTVNTLFGCMQHDDIIALNQDGKTWGLTQEGLKQIAEMEKLFVDIYVKLRDETGNNVLDCLRKQKIDAEIFCKYIYAQGKK